MPIPVWGGIYFIDFCSDAAQTYPTSVDTHAVAAIIYPSVEAGILSIMVYFSATEESLATP